MRFSKVVKYKVVKPNLVKYKVVKYKVVKPNLVKYKVVKYKVVKPNLVNHYYLGYQQNLCITLFQTSLKYIQNNHL